MVNVQWCSCPHLVGPWVLTHTGECLTGWARSSWLWPFFERGYSSHSVDIWRHCSLETKMTPCWKQMPLNLVSFRAFTARVTLNFWSNILQHPDLINDDKSTIQNRRMVEQYETKWGTATSFQQVFHCTPERWEFLTAAPSHQHLQIAQLQYLVPGRCPPGSAYIMDVVWCLSTLPV